MKNTVLIIALLSLFTLNSNGQNNAGSSDDAARITLLTVMPDKVGGMTEEAKGVLENKLNQITTKNGLGGNTINQRFIITANATEVTKDISATTPTIYSYTLEITFIIGDGKEGTKFASHSFSIKGSGKSETKAYISALKEIKTDDAKYAAFLDQGKKKIIEYYNSKCDFYLKSAQTLSGQHKFNEGIASLVEIPDVCKDCFNKASDLSVSIYREKLEYECQQNIALAKAAIEQKKYDDAIKLVSLYTPDMKCYSETSSILAEIKNYKCEDNMAKARSTWATRDSKGSIAAIAAITSDTKCYPEAQAMLKDINDAICEDRMASARAAWASRDSKTALAALAGVTADSKCFNEALSIMKDINDAICEDNLAKAQSAWSVQDAKSAVSALSLITSDSKCSNEAQALRQEIKDSQCAISYGKAQGAWANRNSAEAAKYLGEIPTNSKCASDAQKLFADISSKLDADAQRKWEFEYEKYQNETAMVWQNMSNQQYLAERSMELDASLASKQLDVDAISIRAARDIGVEQARNQPTTVNYTYDVFSTWYPIY